MKLLDILDENIIDTSLCAKNKLEAITKMCILLKNNNYISDIDNFKNDIFEREKLGETGIGNFIAIPHGQSDSVLKSTICICKLNNEIEWETLDGNGVKVIILFAVQNDLDFAKTHLKLLAEVARKLAKEDVINSLLSAKSSKEVISCFV